LGGEKKVGKFFYTRGKFFLTGLYKRERKTLNPKPYVMDELWFKAYDRGRFYLVGLAWREPFKVTGSGH